MSFNKNKASACASPLPNAEEFPPLTKDPLNFMQPAFKRYLVIKHADPERKMTKLSPFVVDQKLKQVLTKKHTCKVEPKQSGLLLIEVDRKTSYDKLLSTKKLGDIPVVIEEHKEMNSSKGIIFCDNEGINDMTNEELQTEMQNQNVTEVYRMH